MQFHEKGFSIYQGLAQIEWGLEQEYMHTILVGCETQGSSDQGCLQKNNKVVVKFCTQKSVGMQFHENCFSI